MVSLQFFWDGHQTNGRIYITRILAIRRMTIADRMRLHWLHHGTYPFSTSPEWVSLMVYGLRLIRLQYGNMSQNEGFTPICGSFSMWNVMMNQYKPSNKQNLTSFFWGSIVMQPREMVYIYIYTYNSLIRCMDNIRKTPILSGWVGSRKAF